MRSRARRYRLANQIMQSTRACDWSRPGGALGRLIWDPPTLRHPKPSVVTVGFLVTKMHDSFIHLGRNAFSAAANEPELRHAGAVPLGQLGSRSRSHRLQ